MRSRNTCVSGIRQHLQRGRSGAGKKLRHSSDHLPATSHPNTTNFALPNWPPSSGEVVSFRRRAACRAAPSTSTQRVCGVPSRLSTDTTVVSIVSCAPWNNGRPSATISSRRLSSTSGRAKSMSCTRTFNETLAPASRQTRAAALSTTKPLRPRTPATAHAARWWPLESSGRPHRQLRAEQGKAREPETTTEVGKLVNGNPAMGPPWERNKARDGPERRGHIAPLK